jgi:hypothetical protein
MVKKPAYLHLVIFGIFIILLLSLNLYIEKEKQATKDDELTTELTEEQNVQDTVRFYIASLKKQDIEKYNSVVVDDLKINSSSLYFTKIMTNVTDSKYVGDNLSAIHLLKNDRKVSIKVKYEISFRENYNPEGIYNEGRNKCNVLIDLIKIDKRWTIKKVHNVQIV